MRSISSERTRAPESGNIESGSGVRSSRRGLLLALGAALVSGIAVFVNGRAVGSFPSPTVYTTGKNLVAGTILLVVALGATRSAAGRRDAASSVSRHPALFGALAIVGGAVPFVLFFEGLARASSTDAAFIHKTLVIWAAILAAAVLGERLGLLHVVAIAALVAGHAALAGGVGAGDFGAGEVMILLATLCWAVELVVVKRLVADVPASIVAMVRLVGGSLLLLVWLAATGALAQLFTLTSSQWAWLAVTGPMLALFVSVWFLALASARVIDVTAILVLGAVVTGVVDSLVGDGSGLRLPGDGLILVGVALVLVAAAPAARQEGGLARWT